ncbi:MAG: hypothetical protein K9J85_09990, partial [Desulfobacteraceae bacterium]|nr:hypothetical protein [Desulfobacteraceae bacterium]
QILEPPASMKDFLNDRENPSQDVEPAETTNRETGSTGQDVKASAAASGDNELDRLHIQIRRDLKIKLKKAVFERSLERSRKNGASERAVIEEALEHYLRDQ